MKEQHFISLFRDRIDGRGRSWHVILTSSLSVKTSLPPGCYEYKFLVDNQWVEGHPGTELVPNQFGTQNCFLRIE